ncbi:uncharacterized protein LOC123312298 [Coccinella septempunctata]|uniref:uncharacterized protein LOC123312298 n=1 Tax=Coccinella septempunctata TaxID=41139 RepID=UPI001D0837E7|nr:uncharacterized protein LOC123312298 [Coccinella septempunctata]
MDRDCRVMISQSAPHTPVNNSSVQHQLSEPTICPSKTRATPKGYEASNSENFSWFLTEKRKRKDIASSTSYTSTSAIVPVHSMRRTLTFQREKNSSYFAKSSKEKVSDIQTKAKIVTMNDENN